MDLTQNDDTHPTTLRHRHQGIMELSHPYSSFHSELLQLQGDPTDIPSIIVQSLIHICNLNSMEDPTLGDTSSFIKISENYNNNNNNKNDSSSQSQQSDREDFRTLSSSLYLYCMIHPSWFLPLHHILQSMLTLLQQIDSLDIAPSSFGIQQQQQQEEQISRIRINKSNIPSSLPYSWVLLRANLYQGILKVLFQAMMMMRKRRRNTMSHHEILSLNAITTDRLKCNMDTWSCNPRIASRIENTLENDEEDEILSLSFYSNILNLVFHTMLPVSNLSLLDDTSYISYSTCLRLIMILVSSSTYNNNPFNLSSKSYGCPDSSSCLKTNYNYHDNDWTDNYHYLYLLMDQFQYHVQQVVEIHSKENHDMNIDTNIPSTNTVSSSSRSSSNSMVGTTSMIDPFSSSPPPSFCRSSSFIHTPMRMGGQSSTHPVLKVNTESSVSSSSFCLSRNESCIPIAVSNPSTMNRIPSTKILQFIARVYSEMVVDCNVFDNPIHLFHSLKPLCAYVCELYASSHSTTPTTFQNIFIPIIRLLLTCIGYILSHRDSIITAAMKNQKEEKELWNQTILLPLSTLFDESSWWINSNFTQEDTSKVIYTLQRLGILSFLDCGVFSSSSSSSSMDHCRDELFSSIQPLQWPFPAHLSTRRAFLRIGPLYPLTSPFTTYDTVLSTVHCKTKSSREIGRDLMIPRTKSAPLLKYLHDDIIRVIFSFLGYKLLVRATSVCKDWNRIGNEDLFWKPLYLKRFKAVQCQTIVRGLNVAEKVKNAYLESKYSHPSEKWRHLFDWKWKMEKAIHRQYIACRKTRPKTCDFVGCRTILYGNQSMTQHAHKHVSKVTKDINLFEKRNFQKSQTKSMSVATIDDVNLI